MCFAQFAQRNSFLYIESSLSAVSHKLHHSGISSVVPRNTLAKANEQKDWRIHADFAQVLVKKVCPQYSEDPFRIDIDNMVYAFDSSTISLWLKLCPWAKFRKCKGGIKMHTLLDLRENIPTFIHLTNASVHDVKMLDELFIEAGAIYLVDKGYVDFGRLYLLIHQKRASFVTRAKDNMTYKVISSAEADKSAGMISDEPNFIENDGMSNFSSNGLSNIFTLNRFMAPLIMPSTLKYGLRFVHFYYKLWPKRNWYSICLFTIFFKPSDFSFSKNVLSKIYFTTTQIMFPMMICQVYLRRPNLNGTPVILNNKCIIYKYTIII
jgi:hypothetical protein